MSFNALGNEYERKRIKGLKMSVKSHAAIIGCGSLGTRIAINLALIGVKNFILFDFDTVEEKNLCTLPYSKDEIGELKTHALKRYIKNIQPEAIVTCFKKYKSNLYASYLSCINENISVYNCVDNPTEKISIVRETHRISQGYIKPISGGYDGVDCTIFTAKAIVDNPRFNILGDGEYNRGPNILTVNILASCMIYFESEMRKMSDTSKYEELEGEINNRLNELAFEPLNFTIYDFITGSISRTINENNKVARELITTHNENTERIRSEVINIITGEENEENIQEESEVN
jgi:hypothetical protein